MHLYWTGIVHMTETRIATRGPLKHRMESRSRTLAMDFQFDGAEEPVVAVCDLTKTYWLGRTRVEALRGITLKIYPGEFVAITGPSGSGKSTFMNLIGCLDRPGGGEYWLTGVSVSRMSPNELAAMRNLHIGFVFQGFHLLTSETAVSNVMLPLMYAGATKRVQEQRAYHMLQLVGLQDRAHHRPDQLSGGQQQRVAIARALANRPSLLLADEPTGNLDSNTSQEIIALLKSLNSQGITVIIVTHDPTVAASARRQIAFHDGEVVSDEAQSGSPSPQPTMLTKGVET